MGEKTRALDERKSGEIVRIREMWADLANRALERADHNARIDHRSLADQGIDREPTVHLGVAAAAMERRGIRTELGDANRNVIAVNWQLQDVANRWQLGDEEFTEIVRGLGLGDAAQTLSEAPEVAGKLSEAPEVVEAAKLRPLATAKKQEEPKAQAPIYDAESIRASLGRAMKAAGQQPERPGEQEEPRTTPSFKP
jgi:hypothetical protein